MINPIINSKNNNVFAPLRSSGATFAITKPFTQEQKQEVEVEKEKKSNAFGYGIAISALMVGFGVFAVVKGMPKIARHKINKFFRRLEDKTTTLDKNKQKTVLQTLYFGFLNGVKEVTKRSKTLFNAAPLKDAAVMHWLEKTPKLKKWSDKITNVFEKISIKTSKRAYSSSFAKWDTTFANFATASKKLSPEDAKKVEKLTKEIKTILDDDFCEATRNQRLIDTKKDMDGIADAVYNATYRNVKGFAKDAVKGSFISEDLAAQAKMKLNKLVNSKKEVISISSNDNYIATKKLLNNIYDFVDQSEATPRTIMKNLKKELASYKKALDNGAKAEDAFPEHKVAEHLKALEEYFTTSSNYDQKIKKQVTEYINDIKSTLTDKTKKGKIQEIMDIFKQANLPEEDINKLNQSVKGTIKTWDKATDMETDKLFDKIRDLLIGAAPVDVLSVISSLGVIGWGLAKAENKDERASAALKYGIPAIGAVAISLYCTVGLIAGGPSLIIGLVSGVLINKLGVLVDDTRKKYNNKQQILPDPTKIMQGIKENAIKPSVKNKSTL